MLLRPTSIVPASIVALCAFVTPLRAEDRTPFPVHHVTARQGMVVSATQAASEIGRDVLKRGGNAVDAAVATALALAVDWPEAGNLGGGGFMLIRPADGRSPVCIDYREMAPAAASTTMYRRDEDPYTHRIVGVPGTVRGLALAHERFGKLPWKDLVLPAVALAENGFTVDEVLADSLNGVLERSSVKSEPAYAELRRVYGRADQRPWKAGDRLVLPDLGATLRQIAEDGPDAFYRGRIADLIAEEMQRGRGLITKDDLARYVAKVRTPVRGEFRGHEILGPPPPSSGGTCLVQMLRVLETFDLRQHDRLSARNLHLIAEAMRRAYCDRAKYLGDADFVAIPPHLTTPEHARRQAASIDPQRATPSATLAPEIALAPESPDTTHFSVCDRDGMAVANTYTLEASWGSRIVVRGAGFVLNNEMIDFNWTPGRTDRSGAIGTPANLIAPGKRMLSSQTPTIVSRDGKAVLITGSPGSRTIINTVLQVVLNVTEFGMDLPTALATPRIHHQWFPDQIKVENVADPKLDAAVEQLRALGHDVVRIRRQGLAHSIAIDSSGVIHGGGDRRRGGFAAGF